MDNIILGTSLACAVGVAAAFRADLRALRARERAMRQGAEFSWGPNGHELRVVLPGLRSAEVTAVESGRIEAALLVEPPVLFLLIRFREQTDRVALGLVCSCCWWGSPEERTDPPASEVVRFVLVEGQSGIVPRSEHPASLWNSPGRCTVPSMSRHGLVTTLHTKSRLRRWFASTRPINCGIAARCDAAHKRARSNHESERVADPLRPREPRPERGPFPPRRPPAAVEFRCPPGVAAAIGLNLRAVHGRSLRGRPHNTPPDGSAAAAVLIRGSDPPGLLPGQGSSRLIGGQADHLPREVTPGAEGPLGAPTYRGIKHVQEPNQQEAGHPSTFRNRPERNAAGPASSPNRAAEGRVQEPNRQEAGHPGTFPDRPERNAAGPASSPNRAVEGRGTSVIPGHLSVTHSGSPILTVRS